MIYSNKIKEVVQNIKSIDFPLNFSGYKLIGRWGIKNLTGRIKEKIN